MAGRNYPISVQSFSYLRECDYIYVDKTMYIRLMLEQGSRFVFLSRPRRFGKSLFLSTLHEFFAGRRDLFDGLAIADYDYDWTVHPVLHLDFTGNDYNDEDALYSSLNNIFSNFEQQYGITDNDKPLCIRFGNLIRQAAKATGQKVVILIDEYNKPMLDTVDNSELHEKFRNTLRGIYGNLKRMDRYIRFAMLTSVTNFENLTHTSDLNNLEDISQNDDVAGICGITYEELHSHFNNEVTELARQLDISIDDAFNILNENYGGYHFSPDDSPNTFNPFSLLNALKYGKIENYWIADAMPKSLISLIKSNHTALKPFDNIPMSLSNLNSIELDYSYSLYSVLYQTGYLTIKEHSKKDYKDLFRLIFLGIPNREAEDGINKIVEY